MMRVCNLDTCPMGICTQNPELRKTFKGKPEYIIHYLTFVAQELREYMAKLGVRTIDELVGRTDLLHVKPARRGSRASRWTWTASCTTRHRQQQRPLVNGRTPTTSIWKDP